MNINWNKFISTEIIGLALIFLVSGLLAWGDVKSDLSTGQANNAAKIHEVEELSKQRHNSQQRQLDRIENKVDKILDHMINDKRN